MHKPSMFYTSLYVFIGVIVHLIFLFGSDEKIHLNWMLTREISVFWIFAAENNWNKSIEIHDLHLTSGSINLKFKGVVVCSEAVWSYVNTAPSIRNKRKEKPDAIFPKKHELFFYTYSYITATLFFPDNGNKILFNLNLEYILSLLYC